MSFFPSFFHNYNHDDDDDREIMHTTNKNKQTNKQTNAAKELIARYTVGILFVFPLISLSIAFSI